MPDADPPADPRADQVQAATRHTIERLEASMGAHPLDALGDDHPDPWVAGMVDRQLAIINAGQARACIHIRTSGPQPMTGCAWMPGLLACDLCVLLGVFNLDGPEDRRCDRCGHDTLGEGIHEAIATAGPYAYRYGLCDPCFAEVRAAIIKSGGSDAGD
jgi:hypothetical protein